MRWPRGSGSANPPVTTAGNAQVQRSSRRAGAPSPGARRRCCGCPTCERLDAQLAGRPTRHPHRHADRLHDGPDACSEKAAPGGVPGGSGRRRSFAAEPSRRGTTCWPEPMTVNVTSVRSDRQLLDDRCGPPRPQTTPAPTSARQSAHLAVPLAELLDALDQTIVSAVVRGSLSHPPQPFDR